MATVRDEMVIAMVKLVAAVAGVPEDDPVCLPAAQRIVEHIHIEGATIRHMNQATSQLKSAHRPD